MTSTLKILMCDDDDQCRRAFARLLRQHGHTVVELADPRQLMERMGEVRPDAVLLDISMPHLRGDEACAIIKSDARFANTAVFMLTGHSSFGAVQQATNAGADGYLVKPSAVAEVMSLLERRFAHRARMAA
jgi:CheY-like chemotaxis protein